MFKLLKLHIPGSQRITFLLIENEVNGYEAFENEILSEGNYETQLDKIRSMINTRASGVRLPEEKFKLLKDRRKSDSIPDYEYRTQMLRVYVFQFEGADVIWGGEKKDPKQQSRTIQRMRNAKKSFYDQVKLTGVIIEDEEGD